MINIVIPMAGLGSRFSKAGYKKPKPFIDVNGIPMISRVLENLYVPGANYFLIANEIHISKEEKLVEEISNKYNATFIPINLLTEGTACTVLFARKFINNDMPLLIANSDQIVDFNINLYISDCKKRNLDKEFNSERFTYLKRIRQLKEQVLEEYMKHQKQIEINKKLEQELQELRLQLSREGKK